MLYLDSPSEDVWSRFLSGEPVELPDSLRRSWMRSMAAGVNGLASKASSQVPMMVGRGETQLRQEAGERGWRHAKPLLEQLSRQLADNGFLGVWADPDGVILHRCGGGKFLSTAQQVELLEGANWSESVRGTNAIGTALREATEVAVLGRAHLQHANHGLVCYAAPVFSPYGDLIGALDVTSHLATAQDLALAAVLSARMTIEQGMKFMAYNEALHGGLDSLNHLMETCTAPAFLVERDGTLRAMNTRARARFRRALADHHGPWDWGELVSLVDKESTLSLVDDQGETAIWRPVVEPIGLPDQPMAVLVRLESMPARRVSAKQSPLVGPCRALDDMYCADPAVLATLQNVTKLAPTNLPILLLAETGTGKERLARALHELSNRHDGPFLPINCGALTESLLESELFGYGPGAFTGAQPKGSWGKIHMADGGTLFLDEVADMSFGAQTRLLRFLEDGSYYRVGESIERRADVRVIAATCRPIEQMVAENRMRADLFYRLKGATLSLPPVRERSDIRTLAEGLIRDLSAELRRPVPAMTRGFIQVLQGHDWPGNVRELKNALHVALVLSDGARLLRAEHLPGDIQQAAVRDVATPSARLVDRAEADVLQEALNRARNMSEAARILGVARSTLYRMLKKHGLR